MKHNFLAAIDIGTNTFRLLIAEVIYNSRKKSYSFNEAYSDRVITRLGEGMHETGILIKEAIERSVHTLRKFSDDIARYNVYRASALATSALREAHNGDDFLKRVKDESGLDIQIITGEREADLTAKGMLIDIDIPECALMLDIGGGSTEIISACKGKPITLHSLNLGAVHLAGRYIISNPPSRKNLIAMDKEISASISSLHSLFRDLNKTGAELVGTAGTITTLAAVSLGLREFDHSKLHNTSLTFNKVRSIYKDISTITLEERAKYIPFEPERLDIIVPGTLILLRLMEAFDYEQLTVSDFGLREGILIDLYEKCGNDSMEKQL